ncbi:MAG: hypothetical protein JNM65_06840 [Verrucomicrobiaceae bacterium]|nr:hypothetical protein [Verrucomicrobiaceae bacterium]
MPADATLPGPHLPTKEEELEKQLQKTFLLIHSDFGGDVEAYFQKHFAAQKEKEKKEEAERWRLIQNQLLKRQASR